MIKTIKAKQPVTIPYEDENGTLHNIVLPGELSIKASILFNQFVGRNETDELSEDEFRDMLNSLLGEKNTTFLIDDLNTGEQTLVEIISAYVGEIEARKKAEKINPKLETSRRKTAR